MTLRILTLACLALFALTLFPVSGVEARIYENGEQPKPYIIEGVVTIQFEDDVDLVGYQKGFGRVSFGLASLEPILNDLQVSDARPVFPQAKRPEVNSGLYDLTRYYELSFPAEIKVADVIEAINQNPHIRMAEPVWAMPLLVAPNDPEWGSQWHMQSGAKRALFPDAWDIETGSDSIKLAMIDSGVNYNHRDLAPNIWINEGEDMDGDRVVYDVDDLNGIDDDGNGVVDDLIGYDFFTGLGGGVWPGEDAGGVDSDPNDFSGHGTNCAGIAAAATNNGLDVTGVAGGWHGGHRSFGGVRIMCLRVGATGADGNGYVNSNNCGTAIDYAASNGANAISCSWGSQNTTTMIAGMANAAANGVTVTHAAGNGGADGVGDNDPDYLDFDPFTNVLSVAALNSNDIKAGFSNFGGWIDVSAPGVNIYNTYSDQYTATLASLSGTSMACPMVAGLALLVRSAKHGLTKEQVDSIVINTADNIDALNPLYIGQLGSGRINALNALSGLPSAKFTSDVSEGNVPLTVNFTDNSPASPNLPTAWDWTFGDGNISSMQNPSNTYTSPGMYNVSLLADVGNGLGDAEEHLLDYVWVRADTMRIDSVATQAGEKIMLSVNLTNTSPIIEIQLAFWFNNTEGVDLDSFSVAGTRSEDFYSVSYNAQVPTQDKYSLRMRSSNVTIGESHYLAPGAGSIVNLYFDVPSSASAANILVDSLSFNLKTPNCASIWGDYWPVFIPGQIVIEQCAHGDVNCDLSIDIVDLTDLVGYLFQGGTADSNGGDVNGSGFITIEDVTYLVEYLFNGGPPPPAK
ncbi:MAG: S8 family serine peptidase [bacterium]|nr:S8 family serine peptidase [bacterium]